MPNPPKSLRPPRRIGLVLALGLAMALAVLAAVLIWAALNLRRSVAAELTNRVGDILDSVASAQYLEDIQRGDTLTSLDDPTEQFELALKVSRLRDVIGVRLFAPDGKFVNAFPANVLEGALPAADLANLRQLIPANHYLPHSPLDEQEMLPETNSVAVPLLLVDIPLRTPDKPHLAGVIQFVMDGSSLARQFAALDRQLIVEFSAAFGVAGSLLAIALVLAFGRLQRANRLLAQRTGELLRANRELTLAAKTSAVGAVTAYLIHGLKNPLTGLQNFVRHRAAGDEPPGLDDWHAAAATTNRMQDLINRVVRVLQEQNTAATYELSCSELGELLSGRVQTAAQAANVRWEMVVNGDGTLSSREADLILLILENLVQNAVEATQPGKLVQGSIVTVGSEIIAQVRDEGPGLPTNVRQQLFSPCASSKTNGSGLGLAICQQLAKHMGAELRLVSSTSGGTCFELKFKAGAGQTEPESIAAHRASAAQ
jgi:signal transduction histidine kinase